MSSWTIQKTAIVHAAKTTRKFIGLSQREELAALVEYRNPGTLPRRCETSKTRVGRSVVSHSYRSVFRFTSDFAESYRKADILELSRRTSNRHRTGTG